MSEKDLRTKITELPLCEDESLIDTLLAIGTDGKTYRVQGKNISGGSSVCEPLRYQFSSRRISLPYVQNPTMGEKIKKGGFIHFVVNVSNANLDIPILFDEDSMLSYTTYDDLPIYVFDQSVLFFNDTKKDFQILRLEGIITRAYFTWNDRSFIADVSLFDYKTGEADLETTLAVGNVYFEPKSIPQADLIEG